MEQMLGQLLMFAGNYAPRDWAFCDGKLLPIASHQALFSLLGTSYGGDGRTNFGLPDLRGRIAMHPGQGPGLSPYSLGQSGGLEQVALKVQEIPAHTHKPQASNEPADKQLPDNAVSADEGNQQFKLFKDTANTEMLPTTSTGGDQGHNNMQPFQCVNFIIALEGYYPSRS